MQIKLNKKNTKEISRYFILIFLLIFISIFFSFILFISDSNKRISNFLINSAHRVINQIYHPNDIETINININFKNYQKLKENRKKALSKKLAERENFKWVKANISINKKKYKAKIRIKGTHSDHYNDPKKWSFNVKLKNNSYDGIKRFTIQPPKTSGYLNEWFFQKAIHHNGLISRRNDFYNVIVNGHKLGLYFFQEGSSTKELIENNHLREGPILSYDKSIWVKDINEGSSTENSFFDSNIEVDYQNKIKSSQIFFKNLAIKRLETLRREDINLNEIIDIEKFAKLMMLYTLMGGDEFDWRDIKFYYNPMTSLLEPIGKELHLFRSGNINLTWQLGKINSDYQKDQKDFHEIFFKNEQFKKIYFNELNKAIKNNLIQKILDQNNQEIQRLSEILSNYYLLYKNEKIFNTEISKIIDAKINSELADKLKDFEDKTYDENDIKEFVNKHKNLNLFEIDFKKKKILFKKGEHTINEQIIFPKNYTTFLKPGTKIIFKNDGNFIFNEAIEFVGKKNNQIEFLSENTKNNSNYISVIKAEQNSIINYCNFKYLSAPIDKSEKGFLGSLNFYESDIKIENSTFKNNLNGDDYVNIVRSKFKIQNIIFENVLHDALDSDFSYGQINNMVAKNVLNDGLDFSGSTVEMTDIYLDTISDKGISVGENSKIKVKNYKIKNSNIGLASKDLSKLIGKNIFFENLETGFALYQKKSEFGPAEGIINDLNILNVKNPFLVQKNSKLMIDNNKIQTIDYAFEDL